MINAPDANVMRPYLIRALHEWCVDNHFTPYIAVVVNDGVQVPREYVKDGQIVLNLSFDATSSLQLGNDYIEFKARFGGAARQIMVPVNQVIAIYARETGQGMAFPVAPPLALGAAATFSNNLVSVPAGDGTGATNSESGAKVPQLTSVGLKRRSDQTDEQPEPPRPPTKGPRPALKRVK
jgi:stringent starvation protein B